MSILDLPPIHRRSVAVTLRLLEERITEVERWLQETPERSAARTVAMDVDPGRRPALLEGIQDLRATILDALEALDLPPDRVSLYQRCQGTLGLSWELCPDLRPDRMTGYGSVPEAAAPALMALATVLEKKVVAIEVALGPRVQDPTLPREERGHS